MTEPTAPVRSADQMRQRLLLVAAASTPAVDQLPADVGPLRRRFRERVALLDYFDPRAVSEPRVLPAAARTPGSSARTPRARLTASFVSAARKLLRGDARSAAPQLIVPIELNSFAVEDCELVTTRVGSAWRLTLDIRMATLEEMGAARALSSLSAVDAIRPGDDDVTHRMARRLLEGTRGLRGLSPTELSGMLRAVEWLARLDLVLPAEADIRAALDLANVLAPLRSVATADFVGRERELAMLASHLYDGSREAPVPLVIHGTGGVGKSTLLATFVLDHVEDETQPMLFSYLSFDRAELDPQFPLTLLSEMCRQVALQSPELTAPLGRLRHEIDAVLVSTSALRDESTVTRGSAARDVSRRSTDEELVIRYFAEALGAADARRPFLLVLDTFEVAQRRRRSSLHLLDDLLHTMRNHLPSLRIVIAGRAEVSELEAHNEALGGLDRAQARALLHSALGGLGVQDALVQDVVTQVSGNPLSLRLAADLMRREGPHLLATRRGRRRLLFDLRSEQVQGVLYRRILDHVAPAIRPLANPGLVVRQMTSDVIAQVLAEPCGLGKLSKAEADRLFELLRADVSLVTEARPGVLVHRADVRREMLPLLDADDHERVVDIHHRAIRYYEGRPEIDDQIEHLYHRLMLGESSSTLDEHWHSGAGPFLEAAMPELPPEARVYLAGKLNIEADVDDLRAADELAWVRQATRQSRALLDAGQPGEALKILSSNPQATRDLSISRLIVESLAAQGRHADALAEVRAAVADADERGLAMDFVQLNILGGRVAEDASAFEEAGRFFREARESAQDLGARIDSLTAGVGVLRLVRRSGVLGSRSASRELREQLKLEVATLTDREKAMRPGLLRELAAELGSDLPGLLADASAHIGIETEGVSASHLAPGSQSVLRETVEEALSSQPYAYPASYPSPPAGLTSPGDDPSPPMAPPAAPATSSAQGSAVSEALLSAPDADDLKSSLTEYWQLEADRASFDYNIEPPSASS